MAIMVLITMCHLSLIILCTCKVTCCHQDNYRLTTNHIPTACGRDGVCDCYDDMPSYDELLFEVDCIGNSIQNVPRNIPTNTSYLVITKTLVTEISGNVFGGSTNLSGLYLNNNKISTMTSDIFQGLFELGALNLALNKIHYIPLNVFQDLPSLVFLNLGDNKIQKIEEDTFKGISNLRELDIGFNELTSLSNDIFQDLELLLRLYLNDNKITSIRGFTFRGLRSLLLLDLSRNKLRTLPAKPFEDLPLLENLHMSKNAITVLHDDSLLGLSRLVELDLSFNKLTILTENMFTDSRNLASLNLSFNGIRNLSKGAFEDLLSLRSLDLSSNKLRTLSSKLFENFTMLDWLHLSNNLITELRNDSFVGLSALRIIHLDRNKIRFLAVGSLRGITNVDFLDLSGNNIVEILPGLFNQTHWKTLRTIFLQRNNLTIIHRNAFHGLDMLTFLCLYSNQIHTIEDNVFSQMNLWYLYLFQNKLTNITGNPFESNTMKQLHLYGNEINYFDPDALMKIPSNTTIFISCNFLRTIPRNSIHSNIACVSPSSLPHMEVRENIEIAESLGRDGFNCTFDQQFNSICTPCRVGTYGDTVEGGCFPCPRGGFYQDEIAQTMPTNNSWNIPCKLCNEGTYAKTGRATSAKDCEVCPGGTNQTIEAGYRACYCKETYARTDRYGPCYVCLQEGLDCNKDFQALLPGYMWNWSFPGASIANYKNFVANLRLPIDPSYLPEKYDGDIPRVFKCPRSESCPNDNDSIAGNCANGYTGWLCTSCETGYYSVLTLCVACPGLMLLIVESCVFFIGVLACVLLSWQIKHKAGKDSQTRSFLDVMIARIKILLGFYQVVGEIFTSLHDINWTGPLVVMGKFISAFEVNILRLFIRPRCFDVKLALNPKIQFVIGAVAPMVIVLILVLVYQAKKVYVRIRFSPVVRMSFRSEFKKLKSSLVTCVVVLWFIMYPPVCSVIFSLYPISCKSFPLDQGTKHSITRLRSDFDVDCQGLKAYHISAFILTATYVIAFPIALVYLLRKDHLLSNKKESYMDDRLADSGDDTNASLINNSPDDPSRPTWPSFLCENYKRQFWYWEIVELARKVTQTLLITLFGWEDRLTVILTTCISVLFLLLHARFRPMKSSYEQGLQMFSLTVIFINVVVAANDFPEEQENSISTILVMLNIIVLVIITGELLVTIIIHVKHLRVANVFKSSIHGLRRKYRNANE